MVEIRPENMKEYWKSGEWAKIKADLITTRGKNCEYCGENSEILHVHHLTYVNYKKEEPEDLVLLCRDCHFNEHRSDSGVIRRKKKGNKVKELISKKVDKEKKEETVEAKQISKEKFLSALEKLGWSQAYFAKKSGLHRNAVNRWCTGKTKVPKIVDLYFDLAFRLLEIKESMKL